MLSLSFRHPEGGSGTSPKSSKTSNGKLNGYLGWSCDTLRHAAVGMRLGAEKNPKSATLRNAFRHNQFRSKWVRARTAPGGRKHRRIPEHKGDQIPVKNILRTFASRSSNGRVVPAGSPGSEMLLAQELFVKQLALERARTERSGRRFVLMLLDPSRLARNGAT